MNDLFGKLGASIKNTCKEAADQTQRTLDQTKYRTEILSLKNELKKLYTQLGERYYKELMNIEEVTDYTRICNRITGLSKEVERLEKEIGYVVTEQKDSFDSYKRNVKTTWNEDINQETSQSKTYQRDENNIKMFKFCDNCNVGNQIDATYCVNCGHKF